MNRRIYDCTILSFREFDNSHTAERSYPLPHLPNRTSQELMLKTTIQYTVSVVISRLLYK